MSMNSRSQRDRQTDRLTNAHATGKSTGICRISCIRCNLTLFIDFNVFLLYEPQTNASYIRHIYSIISPFYTFTVIFNKSTLSTVRLLSQKYHNDEEIFFFTPLLGSISNKR